MTRRWLWIPLLTLFAFTAPMVAQAKDKPAAQKSVKKKAPKKKKLKLALKLTDLDKKTKPKAVKQLRKKVKKVKGVLKVKPNKKKGLLIVVHKLDADVEAIKAAVGEAGFTVLEPGADKDADDEAPIEEASAPQAGDDDLPEDF